MSTMIDRLNGIANDVGSQAAGELSSGDVSAALNQRIGAGVRRRRATAAAITGGVVALLVVAGVVVPRIIDTPPVAPATTQDIRSVKVTTDGLVSYSDGTMSVVKSNGQIVNVPAPAADSPTFATMSVEDACTAQPAEMGNGWTRYSFAAVDLVTFGRSLLVTDEATHVLSQGQAVTVSEDADRMEYAFSVDVDPGIASHVVIVVNSYVTGLDGPVVKYSSQIDSQPTVEFVGSTAEGTYTATLTTRPQNVIQDCSSDPSVKPLTHATRYSVATVFLNDGKGQLTPLASHTSWIYLTKEGS